MKKIKFFNKKGSHVGIVLSFIIFISFLVFLYFILNPSINLQKDKQIVLDELEEKLIEKFSSELLTVSILGESNLNERCIKLEDIIDTDLGGFILTNNLIVKNNETKTQNITYDGKDLNINRSDINNLFFRIYQSPEIDETISFYDKKLHCKKMVYSIESLQKNNEIFESKINKTLVQYDHDYSSLKEELNIPPEISFSFSFSNKDGKLNKTADKTTLTSVYAEEIPIIYVDGDINLNSGFMTIEVW
ncbi:MAG: hypothetical protein ABH811_01920 [archaeon]